MTVRTIEARLVLDARAECGEGPVWSSDRGVLWWVDTPRGLVDSEGFVWVAIWGAAQVRRYSPGGRLDTVVTTGASHTTCPGFGGPGYGDLYITSATEGLSSDVVEAEPDAGGLWVCRPGTAGSPPGVFGG